MNKTPHQVGFYAGLSNGETIYEGKGDWIDYQDGRSSPWQRLQTYLAENKVEIRSFGLYVFDAGEQYPRTFNLPSLRANPEKIRPNHAIAFNAPRPFDYHFFRGLTRKQGSSGEMEPESLYTVAEAIYQGAKMQIWVDEANTKNCWTLLVHE